MSWHVLPLKDIAPTPWKNGGGTTRELVAGPDPHNWVWRLSVAEVAQGGPFSAFAGVHRWFAVLSGGGVQLTHETRRHVLHEDTAPLDFAGDTPMNCQLLDGPTQDFNLMVKQGVAARMSRIKGSYQTRLDTPKMIAAYTDRTGAIAVIDAKPLAIDAHTLIWQHLPVGSQVQVHAENALWMEIDV